MSVLPAAARSGFLGWKGSLWVTVLGLALNVAASSCCFCSSFTYKAQRWCVNVVKNKRCSCAFRGRSIIPSAPSDCSSQNHVHPGEVWRAPALWPPASSFQGEAQTQSLAAAGPWTGGPETFRGQWLKTCSKTSSMTTQRLRKWDSPLHSSSPPASFLSLPSSLAPSRQRRKDRPPHGGALGAAAGRGGQSEALGAAWLVTAVLPSRHKSRFRSFTGVWPGGGVCYSGCGHQWSSITLTLYTPGGFCTKPVVFVNQTLKQVWMHSDRWHPIGRWSGPRVHSLLAV